MIDIFLSPHQWTTTIILSFLWIYGSIGVPFSTPSSLRRDAAVKISQLLADLACRQCRIKDAHSTLPKASRTTLLFCLKGRVLTFPQPAPGEVRGRGRGRRLTVMGLESRYKVADSWRCVEFKFHCVFKCIFHQKVLVKSSKLLERVQLPELNLSSHRTGSFASVSDGYLTFQTFQQSADVLQISDCRAPKRQG